MGYVKIIKSNENDKILKSIIIIIIWFQQFKIKHYNKAHSIRLSLIEWFTLIQEYYQ